MKLPLSLFPAPAEALLVVLVALVGCAHRGGEGAGTRTDGASNPLDDQALFLAGMGSGGFLAAQRESMGWETHRIRMERMWERYEEIRGDHVRFWSRSQLGDLRRSGVIFYPFSGADFLYANAMFPDASTYLMCGLESCEMLPDLARLSPREIAIGLDGIYHSLDSVLYFSYFLTKEMRVDFSRTRLRGVVPPLLVFLARSGHRIESIRAVGLDRAGKLVSRSADAGAGAPGIHIVARAPGGKEKNIYYFQENLGDGNLARDRRLFSFAASRGPAVTYLKSASYLMHEPGFSLIRDHIVERSAAVVQDPSGIPFRYFPGVNWDLSLYGDYVGTLDIFSQHHQPDLAAAYRSCVNHVEAMPFGIGYMSVPGRSSMLVARRK
ncbi:MAG: hypothetical protein ACC661_07470 [Verrucomicrobiales bacterium]